MGTFEDNTTIAQQSAPGTSSLHAAAAKVAENSPLLHQLAPVAMATTMPAAW
jgi:hypothetical protein